MGYEQESRKDLHTNNNGSPEQNQEVLRRVIEEGFNKGNYAALDSLFAPGYREHQFGLKTALEGLKEDIHNLRTASQICI